MIERIIENWLDRANERSFQIPFCYVLVEEGYTIIHNTKHNIMEMGKDIIALDPDGKTPCAFQLKNVEGSKLTLSEFRNDLEKQMIPLVYNKIIHPSLKNGANHKPFIVINGEIDEAVQRSIDDFNKSAIEKHFNAITVITKGQLFQKFIDIQDKLWPTELKNVKEFLEIYVEEGNGILPKDKFSNLIFQSLPFNKTNLNERECIRSIASASVICSSAISTYSISNNYFAEFEAWVIYLSYVLALAEKNKINLKNLYAEIEIAMSAIYNSLGRLCDEMIKNDKLIDNDNPAYSDIPLYNVKVTLLCGLMSTYALWRKNNQETENEQDKFIKDFCLKNFNRLDLWGEYAIPQFIIYYFFLRTIDATPRSDLLLYKIIFNITNMNKPRINGMLASPYYSADEILPYLLGIEKTKLNDSFNTSSYTLEALIHLFVKTNWKQQMKTIWPEITKINIESFHPDNMWEFYFWRCNKGKNILKLITPLQKWDDLKKIANESSGNEIPQLIKTLPIFYLCFLIVFPHRLNSSGIRWVDEELKKKNTLFNV